MVVPPRGQRQSAFATLGRTIRNVSSVRKIALDFSKMTGHIVGMPKPNVREQLLTASLATLHSKGYNATSVQDITEAAGVPKGSFYNHFPSKEALGVEVLKRYAEQGEQFRAVLHDTSLPPLLRIERYFASMIEAHVASHFISGCLLGNFSIELSAQSEQIRVEIAASFEQRHKLLVPLIAQAQQEGSVADTSSASELADLAVDCWQGAVLRAKAERQRAPLDRFMKLLMTRILQ
jgi:TetR/AcrR family transcriptional repressor of nem operon